MSLERQNSHSPQTTFVRGLSGEQVVDQRDEYSGRSHSSCGADTAAIQCGRGGADIQRGYESCASEGIRGTGRIFVGGQFLGGWVFCRDGRAGGRRSREEVHSQAFQGSITRLCQRAETPGFSPGSGFIVFILRHCFLRFFVLMDT